MPLRVERETARHIERKAGDVERQRDVDAGGQDRAAQAHVEADRVDAVARQSHRGCPGDLALARCVVESDVDVVDRDQVIAVVVLQDAQVQPAASVAAEGLEHHLPYQLDRLARACERDAQVLQQAAAQVADHLAGVGQTAADERYLGRQAALEQVLHRAQAHVDAVEHDGRVVKHLQQRVLAAAREVEVRQLDHQRLGAAQARDLLDQGIESAVLEQRVGLRLQRAQAQRPAEHRGRQRQPQVKCASQIDHRLAIDQLDLQSRRQIGSRVGAKLAVGIERDAAALHRELQRTDVETQVDALGLHARGQRQPGALAGRAVVVLQAHGQRMGCVGQAQAQSQLQVGAQAQRDAARARCIEKLVEARWQHQAAAGHRHQGREVEVQRQGLVVGQAQVQVDVELVRRAVQAQVQHLGGQAQRLLDQQFGPVQPGFRVVEHIAQRPQPGIADVHQALQGLVDHRQRLGVERLRLQRVVDHLQAELQRVDDVGHAELADVEQRLDIGQHDQDLVAGDGLVGDRLVAVEADLAHVQRAGAVAVQLGQRQGRAGDHADRLGLEGQHLAIAQRAEPGAAVRVDHCAQFGRQVLQSLGLRHRDAIDAQIAGQDGVDQRRVRNTGQADQVTSQEVTAQHDAVDLRDRGRIGHGDQHRR